MKRRFSLVLVVGLLVLSNLCAQVPANLDPANLSQAEVEQLMAEVKARGLSTEQALYLAEQQGATPVQLAGLRQLLENGTATKVGAPIDETDLQTKAFKQPAYSPKAPIMAGLKEKQLFGFQFFNADNLSFEPAVNLPTPDHYVLGIGDELTIAVWGASQKTYKVKVDASGGLHIPDVGALYVSGQPFSQVRELVRKRLVAIFKGMGGSNPTTFCDVSLSNLRAIRINVIGEANAPGTYTLPSTASAFNALYVCGGPGENGSFRAIEVFRDNKMVKTIDVYDYLLNNKTGENIQLRDQDIIKVPVYGTRVAVHGLFKRTGLFELKEGETLSDLVRYAGGLGDQAYQNRVSVRRLGDKGRTMLDVNKALFDSFRLQNGDSVVAVKAVTRYDNRVSIKGAVNLPGQYGLTEGMHLSDLLALAEGVREDYYDRGLILRLQENLTPSIEAFSVKAVLDGTTDVLLQRDDQVIIEDIFGMKEKRLVLIYGEVQRPGEYLFADNMTLKDLIFQAGGFKEAASESFIEVASRHNYEEAEGVLDELVKLHQFDIDRQLNLGGDGDSFILAPFDYVYVRKSPSYYPQRTVYISGEVKYPGPYSIGSKKERVSDLLKRAGGLLPNAFVKGAVMKRENKQAERNINVLESAIEDTLTTTKVKTQLATNSQLELQLESILKRPGTELDYVLKDGDQIIIPELTQEVRISGEVRNPIGLAFKSGKSLGYYVDRNGGYTDKAKKSRVFVIYSDGTTKVTRQFLWRDYPPVEPGCQIVVPAKPEKVAMDNSGKWMAAVSTFASLMVALSYLLPN